MLKFIHGFFIAVDIHEYPHILQYLKYKKKHFLKRYFLKDTLSNRPFIYCKFENKIILFSDFVCEDYMSLIKEIGFCIVKKQRNKNDITYDMILNLLEPNSY